MWTWVGEHYHFYLIFHWHMAHNISWCGGIFYHMYMDEQLKWINQKKDEHNLFTTNSYVLIQTLPIHNQKMCQSKDHLFIFKKYAPIRNWDNMRPHILYAISTYFLFEFSLSNLLCLGSILLFEESNCIISPSPLELPSSIFLMGTTCLQLLNIYFTMAKKKSQQWSH